MRRSLNAQHLKVGALVAQLSQMFENLARHGVTANAEQTSKLEVAMQLEHDVERQSQRHLQAVDYTNPNVLSLGDAISARNNSRVFMRDVEQRYNTLRDFMQQLETTVGRQRLIPSAMNADDVSASDSTAAIKRQDPFATALGNDDKESAHVAMSQVTFADSVSYTPVMGANGGLELQAQPGDSANNPITIYADIPVALASAHHAAAKKLQHTGGGSSQREVHEK